MISRSAVIYASVSALCFLLNNLVLVAMDWAGAPLPASIALSFAIVVVVGYALHGRMSFRKSLSLPGFARYAMAMSANVPLAFVALWGWRDVIHLRIELAAPLATSCMVLVNFGLCRFAVFGGRRTRADDTSGLSKQKSAAYP